MKTGLEKELKEENELVFLGTNEGGIAGLAAKLVLIREDDKVETIVSDKEWRAFASKGSDEALEISINGKMGDGPWGNVFANASTLNRSESRRVQRSQRFQRRKTVHRSQK